MHVLVHRITKHENAVTFALFFQPVNMSDIFIERASSIIHKTGEKIRTTDNPE